MINAYCQKKSLDPSAVRFLFDGMRVNNNNTPQDVSSPQSAAHDLARMPSVLSCPLHALTSWRLALAISLVAAQLGMEDGDSIDCVVEQVGGSC